MARLAYSACLVVVLLAGGSPVSGIAPMGRCGVRPAGIRLTLRGGAPHVIGEDAGAKQGEAKKDEEDEEMGEDADDEDEEEIWKHKSSPLLFAAAGGHLDEVKKLIMDGADVNAATRKKGEAPLHVAAKRGHLEVRRDARILGSVAPSRCSIRGSTHGRALLRPLEFVLQLVARAAHDALPGQRDPR